MFDCHEDLLTYIYLNKDKLVNLKKQLSKIYNEDNVKGGIFNLFYMSEYEMENELGIIGNEIDVISNLKLVNNLISTYNLIPQDIKYIYGIEGLDYLETIEDLEILYDLGLRSVNPVWNNMNKFGNGVKSVSEEGLTDLGEKLIYKLIEVGIAIDVSHANENTFYDIINICNRVKEELRGKEEEKIKRNNISDNENSNSNNNNNNNDSNSHIDNINYKEPVIFASHSNCISICNIPRNLTDDQIKHIVNLDGIIGLVMYKPFCINNNKIFQSKIFNYLYERKYIEHILHIKKLIGNIDNISVSTDTDMFFNINKKRNVTKNIYKLEAVHMKLRKLLTKHNFSEEEIEKILGENFYEKIIKKI